MGDQSCIKLNCRVSGIGHPVVFIHGFLESLSMWDHLDFEDSFTKICVDLPGHGKSPYNMESISSMQSMAELIMVELTERNIPDYTVIGHSMGGYVALELMKMDKRCVGLILLNSNYWEDSAQKKKDRMRLTEIVPKNKMVFLYEAIPNLFVNPEKHNKHVRKIIEEAKSIPVEVITETSISMSKRRDNSQFVREKRSRILIIQGAKDNLITKEQMVAQNEFTEASFIEFENCGHMAHIECSKQTVLAIQNFIQKNGNC